MELSAQSAHVTDTAKNLSSYRNTICEYIMQNNSHALEILFIVDLFVAIIFSVVFFTMAGILFPAKNENPFSAMVGIMFIIMIGLIAVFHRT